MRKKIFAALLLTLALGGFLSASEGMARFPFFGSKYQGLQAENGLVKLPLPEINDGKVHYYSLAAQGRTINFFVIRSNDGVIRAAFDACDVCFSERKGYSQNGDYMICNNCGQAFHSSRINVVKGGCNPAPLRRTTQGQHLIIAVADILAGSRYF